MIQLQNFELEIKGNEKSDDDIHTRIDDEDYQEASGDSNMENDIVSIAII